MSYLFYKKESELNSNSDLQISLNLNYQYSWWCPKNLSLFPKGFSFFPFSLWWLFHSLNLFSNREYGIFLVHYNGILVHRTCVFPAYFRFPFMGKNDLQVGDIWTSKEHRGKNIAFFAIQKVIELKSKPGRSFWYITDAANIASIHVAEKAGCTLIGKGHRSSKFGLRSLGVFALE